MPDAYDIVIADLVKRRDDIDTLVKMLRVMKAMRSAMPDMSAPTIVPGPGLVQPYPSPRAGELDGQGGDGSL